MLLKIHTAYVQESEILYVESAPGGFLVCLLIDQAPDLFVPCPEALQAAARAEVDAQLAGAARAQDPKP